MHANKIMVYEKNGLSRHSYGEKPNTITNVITNIINTDRNDFTLYMMLYYNPK
jgi:hypothetical protein